MLTLYIADAERDVSMKNLSRKEAAKILEDMKVKIEIPKAAVTQWKRNIALDMAVESLSCSEFPNSSDTISRQAAIELVKRLMEDSELSRTVQTGLHILPSAQPEPHCDEWCDDCKEYNKERHCCPRWNRVIRQALKDAQPEPHEGYWIPHEGIDGDIQYECSKCGVLWEFNDGTPEDNEAYFCPKCGADMRGEPNERNKVFYPKRTDDTNSLGIAGR